MNCEAVRVFGEESLDEVLHLSKIDQIQPGFVSSMEIFGKGSCYLYQTGMCSWRILRKIMMIFTLRRNFEMKIMVDSSTFLTRKVPSVNLY